MNRRGFISCCVGSSVPFAGCVRTPPDDSDDPETPSDAGTDTPPRTENGTPDSETRESDPDGSDGPAARLGSSTLTPVQADRRTVSPGDVVERSVVITNEGDERATVLVTLTAVDPYGRWHLDEPNGHQTVDLDPGESEEVTLSWTADEEVPQGEYDLLVEVWNETDLEERLLLLDERTEENAFIVEKPEGTLVVSTIPSDAFAIVYRDPAGRGGVPLGESPIELPVGSYEVAVFHEEYEDVTESVTIQEGETAEVEIDLTEDD